VYLKSELWKYLGRKHQKMCDGDYRDLEAPAKHDWKFDGMQEGDPVGLKDGTAACHGLWRRGGYVKT
jgi:hypothetical protein